MKKYTRVFKVTDGPLVDALKECDKIRGEAAKEYKKILKEIGASDKYWISNSKIYAIHFDGEVDTKAYRRKGKGWWPKKNTKAGKDLCRRLESVLTKDENDCLETVGLQSMMPTIFIDGYGYSVTLVVVPKPFAAYVSVPWYDEDPKEMKDYLEAKSKGKRFEANKEAVLWEPTPEMVEVKEWEKLKAIQEWNDSLKK